MDEPIWQTVKEYTGFRLPRSQGGELRPWQTFFKILTFEDRVYVGARCEEGDEMARVLECRYNSNAYNGSSVELFFSPSGTRADIILNVVISSRISMLPSGTALFISAILTGLLRWKFL